MFVCLFFLFVLQAGDWWGLGLCNARSSRQRKVKRIYTASPFQVWRCHGLIVRFNQQFFLNDIPAQVSTIAPSRGVSCFHKDYCGGDHFGSCKLQDTWWRLATWSWNIAVYQLRIMRLTMGIYLHLYHDEQPFYLYTTLKLQHKRVGKYKCSTSLLLVNTPCIELRKNQQNCFC